MVRYSEQQIIDLIIGNFDQREVLLLAPVVKGRKGHYRELFDQIRKQGFIKVRVDGTVREIVHGLQLDRYKIHDIEIVIDRIAVKESARSRLATSVNQAMRHGKNVLMILDEEREVVRHYSRLLMCPSTGISYSEPEPNSFSFNSPYGACPECNGLGSISEIDIDKIIPDRTKSIRKGGIVPLGEFKHSWIFSQIEAIGEKYGFDLNTPIEEIPENAIHVILNGSDEMFRVKNEYLGVTSSYALNFEGIVSFINSQQSENASAGIMKWVNTFMNTRVCPVCQGTRLKKEALWFRIGGQNIAGLSGMDLTALDQWFKDLEDNIDERKKTIGHEIIREIRSRIRFLLDVGLGYLTLNRSARTLSGGESQRIRLATQIGSQLVGVLYILDEPSIGLHQHDNMRLIKALKDLRDAGNSVIVVEHDQESIMAADWVVDIGPGAGVHGGKIVAQGIPESIKASDNLTGLYLSGRRKIIIPEHRRSGTGQCLVLQGATGNNLKNIDLRIPLGKFICVTGMSGSGKSSLITETLYPILSKTFYRSEKNPLPYRAIKGLEFIDKVIEIDQSPIGRTPRSNPATYTKVFDEIRKLFTELPESKIRGYKPGRFSFNVKGGRCETCKGAGLRVIEMNFLPDVYVPCETCNGHRYNRETLDVRYKGKSINDVLNMTIEQAVDFFDNIPFIVNKIKTMNDVGLGYITLGQQSTTLSGGEAQRVKLASELAKTDTGNTVYILDEPTTGLHFEDVKVLLNVLNKLVGRGNTVLVIEHNLEVIKVADHIIDMGPVGGSEGGYIVAEGTPEEVATRQESLTARYLKEVLMNS